MEKGSLIQPTPNEIAMQAQVAFLRGEIRAVRSLVIALAKTSGHPAEFCVEALRGLESLRTAALPQQLHQNYLDAISDTETFLEQKIAGLLRHTQSRTPGDQER